VHQQTLIIMAVCITALIVVSLIMWNTSQSTIPAKYERNITRNFNNLEEGNAITSAESINYSPIVESERFDGKSDPEAYLNPSTYLEYTYANFIDSEVINYNETRYSNLQGKGDPKQIGLNYEANATKQSEFRIYNSPAPENVTWHNTTIVLCASDGSVRLKTLGEMKFFFRNQSSYQMTQWDFNFNFSNCYVVEMRLQYSEIYAPLAAFWSDVYQIVILNTNLEPVLIGLESFKAIS
jgi:hypothetical protein